MAYGLIGKLKAKEGKVEELAQILLQASDRMTKLDDCHQYVVGIAGDEVVISEVWKDKESHDASLKMPEVGALIAQAMPLLAEMPSGGIVYEVLGGV